jgi:hypothetical protein
MVARSFFMTWHMQQEDREKMITGCSDISRWILVSVDSASSMDKEEDEEEFSGELRSRRSTSSEQRCRSPCIARGENWSVCVLKSERDRERLDVDGGSKWEFRGRSFYIYKWRGRGRGRGRGVASITKYCEYLYLSFFLPLGSMLVGVFVTFQAHAPMVLDIC